MNGSISETMRHYMLMPPESGAILEDNRRRSKRAAPFLIDNGNDSLVTHPAYLYALCSTGSDIGSQVPIRRIRYLSSIHALRWEWKTGAHLKRKLFFMYQSMKRGSSKMQRVSSLKSELEYQIGYHTKGLTFGMIQVSDGVSDQVSHRVSKYHTGYQTKDHTKSV